MNPRLALYSASLGMLLTVQATDGFNAPGITAAPISDGSIDKDAIEVFLSTTEGSYPAYEYVSPARSAQLKNFPPFKDAGQAAVNVDVDGPALTKNLKNYGTWARHSNTPFLPLSDHVKRPNKGAIF